MKTFFVVIAMVLGSVTFSLHSLGQVQTYDNAAPPVVIPASPTAAALFHDVDVPIDYYTGGQKLSIPIHTVKIGTLQVPITLSYRATGIKVEEEAGWTGLGWDLSAAGAIGRSVVGFPDEDLDKGYRRTAAFLGMPDPTDFNAINAWFTNFSEDTCNQYNLSLGKNMEMTPDNYFINLCGNSARLFFDQNSHPYFSPYKPWKITGNEASGFSVVTDDGTTYVLQLIESSTNTVETLPTDDHSTPITANTSWYLTQIISANKTDTVNISYKAVSYNVISYIPTESISLPWSGQTNSPCGQGTPQSSHTWTYLTHAVAGYVVSSISTRNQRVDFISNANRADIPDNTKGMPYKLDSIMIYATAPGASDNLINKFTFSYDYYNSGASTVLKRLRLLSLTQSDAVNIFPQRYSFTYHDSTLPAKTSKGQDLWGYYNGKNGNSTMIPTYMDPNGVVTTLADRGVDSTQASLGLLTSIKYPTGGTTSFEYESNRAGQADSLVATATLSAHTAFVGYTTPTFDQQTFTVPWPQTVTIGTEIHEPDNLVGEGMVQLFAAGNSTPIFTGETIGNLYTTLHLNAGVYTITASKEESTAIHVSALIFVTWQDHVPAPYIGNPIGGARIKRMVQSDGTNSIIKRFTYLLNDTVSSGETLGTSIYSSMEYIPQICSFGGAPAKSGEWTFYGQHSTSVTDVGGVRGGNVAYTKVTVLNGDNGENGREEYYYSFSPDIGGGGYPYGPSASFDDVRGLLVKKWVYRSDSNLVQKVENTYSLNTDHGDPNFRSIYGVKTGTRHRSTAFGTGGCPAGPGWGFSSRLYQVDQFWPTLYTTAQTTYSSTGQDSLTTMTWFNYDTLNAQVVKQAMLTSKSDSVITYSKYADGSLGNPVCVEMINRNMINVPVELDEYRNAAVVAKKVTNFGIFSSGGKQMVLPSTIQLQHGSGPLETRLQLNSYDKWGNLQSQNKTNDIRHIYLYDYQDVYPIADVMNADTDNVAYTSFEADGTGKWTIGSASRDTTQGITGTRSYNLNSDISKSSLSSATTYFVSYWTKNNGAFSINGTIAGYPTKGKTINGWTLYVHKVTGQTTISIGGSGLIDELRLYPADAQMTTYTYTPLVGLTSQCDIGNRITYYEYDGLQRLKRIRDQDFNIIKSLDYQYQASSGCGSNCYRIAMQTFAGTVTLSYPVGAFNVHGKLLGNATGPAQYVNLWNNDTADARIGTLSTGSDSLHFNMTLNTAMILPAGVTGCRYYQVDLAWNVLDAVRNYNAAYIDFGDNIGMHLASSDTLWPAVMAPNTTGKVISAGIAPDGSHLYYLYMVHTYPDTSQKTITFYHNDGTESCFLDNLNAPATSMTKLRNLRGNLPQHTLMFGGSSYQDPSMGTVAGIANWSTIHSINEWFLNSGDGGAHPFTNLSYAQDFMAGNKDLLYIETAHSLWYVNYYDSTFKLSRLKSDWTSYFTKLQFLSISEDHWDHEDLSVIKNLRYFGIVASNQNHSNNATNNAVIPLPIAEIDTIINQVAAGAGQTLTNGRLSFISGGSRRSASSDTAAAFLKSKGWTIYFDGVLEN